jgi:hypothetical protein
VQALRITLVIIVTAVWVAAFISTFKRGGNVPDSLNLLEAIALGWAFGGATFDAIKRIRIEREDPKKEGDADDRPE